MHLKWWSEWGSINTSQRANCRSQADCFWCKNLILKSRKQKSKQEITEDLHHIRKPKLNFNWNQYFKEQNGGKRMDQYIEKEKQSIEQLRKFLSSNSLLKKYLHLINLFDNDDNLHEIQRIIKANEELLQFKDGNGNSLLHHAVKKGKKSIVEFFIEHNLDYHEQNLVLEFI